MQQISTLRRSVNLIGASAPSERLFRPFTYYKLSLPKTLQNLCRSPAISIKSSKPLCAYVFGLHKEVAARTFQISAVKSRGHEDREQDTNGYLTLQDKYYHELEVKKSKFQTTAWPVMSADQAMALIDSKRDAAASHNCFAYKVGLEFRSSDDGEPGGTAGRPILSAIEGEGLDGVCVLVTRYFGGTKLGAGGLVRAYGGAARECLQLAEKRRVMPVVDLQISVPFESIGAVYSLLDQNKVERLEENYQENSEGIRIIFRVNLALVDHIQAAILDATSGRVKASRLDSPKK